MYLARTFEGLVPNYSIRKSYYDNATGKYRYCQLFDLGSDPGEYIHEYGRTVYFDEDLEDIVAAECQKEVSVALEDLLWIFLPHEERQRIRDFRKSSGKKLSALNDDEKEEVEKYIHIFDRRRMYYVRYGAVDQGRIYRLNDKLYRPLLYKCRDEKEYYIANMERSLSPNEFKKYVFVIFNLQKYFSESYSAYMPEALKEELVEETFLKEICLLNSDKNFWQDDKEASFLRFHLRSYIVRYYDYAYSPRSYERDFYNSFRAKHRSFKWPEKTVLTEESAVIIFGEKLATLRNLERSQLAKLFRSKAKEHHPDSGGNPEKFIELLDAYESLKSKLPK